MAIVVYAPALALAQVTGLNTDLTIGLTFVVCIIYTSLGGLKAVIWTNVFQVKSLKPSSTHFEPYICATWLSGSLHVLFLVDGGHCRGSCCWGIRGCFQVQ
jgi:Na+(H+)/acetate symporter ActP